ncbi:response regulator transcription factor [Dyadobacter jiangsuensis]|uniref:DNA-binding NarL/FixJ family response regulator n=1 Tax=Dyadobacter jiangsuensis TaxID=1591085 RepID=A0A2P8FL89_9BACT|nr:response regulator transcription factor [Dyadobacter jiangsuensis]PSL22503.1 DNA-binding NarL/FixJ family response regulator [Dyadobacter jiangsuensis]
MNVLLIEDHAVVRMGMRLVIRELFQNVTILESEDFNEGIRIVQDKPVDLVVLDIHVPGGQDVKMIDMIKKARAETKILVFSGLPEEKYALKYVQAGADGYLSKRSDPEMYGEAVAAVVNEKKYLSEAVREQLVTQLPQNYNKIKRRKWIGLTDRELEISRLLIKGMWTKEIATQLQLKLSTVSTFKKKIFQKCGVTSAIELSKIIDDVAATAQ